MKALKLKTIDGKIVHAHGGGIIKHGDYYYLYGENRSDDNYVSIYKSNDLKKELSPWDAEFISKPSFEIAFNILELWKR